jgi:hypothetical protein
MADEVYDGAIGIDLGMFYPQPPQWLGTSTSVSSRSNAHLRKPG